MDVPLAAVIAIVGPMLALIGTLIIVNLRSIKSCITGVVARLNLHDAAITSLSKDQADCKIDCDRNTVSKEDWVRSEGYTRKELKELTAAMNRFAGQLGVIDKIPQITAAIVKEVISRINIREPADVKEVVSRINVKEPADE